MLLLNPYRFGTPGGGGGQASPDSPTPITGSPFGDQYWEQVALLMHGSFGDYADSSHHGFTMSVNGTPTANGSGGTGYLEFNASGDAYYISGATAGDVFNIGAGDFTIEFDVYLNATGIEHDCVDTRSAAMAVPRCLVFYVSSTDKLAFYDSSSVTGNSGTSLTTGQWYRVAFVLRDGIAAAFLDGVRQWTATYNNAQFVWQSPITIGNNYTFTNAPNCRLRNIRLTAGISRYAPGESSIYQDPAPFPTQGYGDSIVGSPGYSAPAYNPNWDDVSVQIPLWNGDRGSTSLATFVDESEQHLTVSRNAATAVISPERRFHGDTSLYTNCDRIKFTRNSSHYLAANDFTIECWIYYTGASGDRTFIMGDAASGGGNGKFTIGKAAGTFQWYGEVRNAAGTTYQALGDSADLLSKRWVHVGIMRKGDNLYFLCDGKVYGPKALTAAMDIPAVETTIAIGGVGLYTSGGCGGGFGDRMLGYMQDFRWTRNNALYPTYGTYIPPARGQPFPRWTRDNLLALDFNNAASIQDFGQHPKAWTLSGATLSTTTPLEGFASYLATAATDYAEMSSANDHLLPASGDWDIEFDVKFSSTPTSVYLVSVQDATGTAAGTQWVLATNASNQMQLVLSDGATRSAVITSSTASSTAGMERHRASRRGNNVYLYRNGIQVGTAAYSASLAQPLGRKFRIGYSESSNNSFVGRLDRFTISTPIASP